MERDQLLIKLMEVADSAKPNKKAGHKEREEGEPCKEGRERKHKSPHRMPPSARSVLTVLLREKKLNQRTLAKNTNITAQGISDVLKKLEKDGIITREEGNAYNENLVVLTEKGEELAIKIQEKTRENAEKLFKNCTAEELSMLENILNKMCENAREE